MATTTAVTAIAAAAAVRPVILLHRAAIAVSPAPGARNTERTRTALTARLSGAAGATITSASGHEDRAFDPCVGGPQVDGEGATARLSAEGADAAATASPTAATTAAV